MSALPAETATHESYWSERLFACLQAFADSGTNAVLQVLAGVDHLESGRRYPEDGLGFAGQRWRAFYHCHAADSEHPDEHGHFHIFTACGKEAWAHVAGLSIDANGQPLQWFAVNRWVTDGTWLEGNDIMDRLDSAREDENDNATGRWLLALLQLYRTPLSTLLAHRDERIDCHSKHRNREDVLEDRDIYSLATQRIELQSMLEKHLLS